MDSMAVHISKAINIRIFVHFAGQARAPVLAYPCIWDSCQMHHVMLPRRTPMFAKGQDYTGMDESADYVHTCNVWYVHVHIVCRWSMTVVCTHFEAEFWRAFPAAWIDNNRDSLVHVASALLLQSKIVKTRQILASEFFHSFCQIATSLYAWPRFEANSCNCNCIIRTAITHTIATGSLTRGEA